MADSNGNGNGNGRAGLSDPLVPQFGGRIISAFPLVLPPILPDGRVPQWRYVGRFNQLPVASSSPVGGTRIVAPSEARIGLALNNRRGTGAVFISHETEVSTNHYVIDAGDVLTFSYPEAPMGAIYAAGEGGHDLRVAEVLEKEPAEWIDPRDSIEVGDAETV